MGFWNILGYIGIGLGAAILLAIFDIIFSGSKITLVDDDGRPVGKTSDLNFLGAYVMSIIELAIIGTIMLCVIAHFRVPMAIGISVVGTVLYMIVIGILIKTMQKATKAKTEEDKEAIMCFFFILTCLLNGAGVALLISVRGWF